MASFMIEQMPQLAQIVGRITVNWSGVDLQMSLLLGSLIGVENEAAVLQYSYRLRITGLSARRYAPLQRGVSVAT